MFIMTDRLFLRPLWQEDAPALAARMGDPEVVRNLGTPPFPFTLADAEARIAAEADAGPDHVSLGIFQRPDKADAAAGLVGGIGFGPRADRDGRTALSYWLAREAWGRNIAVEAGEAVLEHAFLARRLDTLVARVYLDNPGSLRVLEKLGFTRASEPVRIFSRPRGTDVDAAEFSLTAEDWEAERWPSRAAA